MSKKDILIVISGLVVLVVIFVASYLLPGKYGSEGKITILTDREAYSPGEELKVKIENETQEKICFSSCYPYFIQKENGNWKDYRYEDCPEENLVEKCIEPKEVKAFELTIPQVPGGSHRLFIGACINCQLNETFRITRELFSNKFKIK